MLLNRYCKKLPSGYAGERHTEQRVRPVPIRSWSAAESISLVVLRRFGLTSKIQSGSIAPCRPQEIR